MKSELRRRLIGIAEKVLFISFVGIGLSFIFGLVVPSIFHYWNTRHQVKVSATLMEVSVLRHTTKRGVVMETIARYTYDVDGVRYEGNKLSLFRRTDQFQNELKEALKQNRPVSVYIDPRNPGFSVYDREFSLWPFSLAVIMGGGFAAAGVHGLIWLRRRKLKC